MKTARVKDGVVVEIVPEYALPVEQWYGEEYAAECVDNAPDEVEIGWTYEGGEFIPPLIEQPEESTASELRQQAYAYMTHKEDGEPLLPWEGAVLTVDAANALWVAYSAEDNTKAEEIGLLIAEAKAYIRELYT